MARDEIAIQLSLDYLNPKRVHDKLINAINDTDISAILDLVQGAYTQGRADAWRWRDIYTEGYPELMTPVLLYREGEPAMTGWVDRENDEHGAIFFSTQNGDEELPHDYFTHWLPITLPGGEND